MKSELMRKRQAQTLAWLYRQGRTGNAADVRAATRLRFGWPVMAALRARGDLLHPERNVYVLTKQGRARARQAKN